MRKISITQKTVLIIFGIFLFFILLEAGLRMWGGVILFFQEQKNKVSLKKRGEYRIVCFGESTTVWGDDNSWPSQLERILNEKNIGIKFRVINKGRHSIDTAYILSILTESSDKYHPDMIITMMGVNDPENMIPYNREEVRNRFYFFSHFKVYKLINLILLHIEAKFNGFKFESKKSLVERIIKDKAFLDESGKKEKSGDSNSKVNIEISQDYLENIRLAEINIRNGEYAAAEEILKRNIEIDINNPIAYIKLGECYSQQRFYAETQKVIDIALTLNPAECWMLVELGNLYKIQGEYNVAEELFKKAINHHADDEVYVGLGYCYKEEGKYIEAEEMFKKAIQLNTKNINAYMYLGICYREHKKYKEAEEIFKKILEENQDNYPVCLELGTVYREQGKSFEQEQVLKKAIEINPMNDTAYVELGWCYGDNERYPEAEEMFKKAIEINPKNSVPYIELGDYYKIQGKFKGIEELTRKAEELIDNNDRFYGYLAVNCLANGEYALAEKYFQKATNIRMKYHPRMTLFNYRRLKEKVTAEGIKLVCVQYPMRNIEPLKKIFDTTEEIIFVDNESLFKQAVKQSKFEEYFEDSFAGDFGHCTPKGNRLLAENVARVILNYFCKR